MEGGQGKKIVVRASFDLPHLELGADVGQLLFHAKPLHLLVRSIAEVGDKVLQSEGAQPQRASLVGSNQKPKKALFLGRYRKYHGNFHLFQKNIR